MLDNERISSWIERTQLQISKDKGLRTVLKRAAGKTMLSAGGAAMAGFYRLPPVATYQEEIYFDVICLMCLWDVEAWKKGKSFVAEARRVLPAERREAFGKKLEALMDFNIDEDGYFLSKLYRLVKYAKSKGAIIDFAQLIDDLSHWDSDKRYVQKRWVKEFCQNNDDVKSEGENKNAD